VHTSVGHTSSQFQFFFQFQFQLTGTGTNWNFFGEYQFFQITGILLEILVFCSQIPVFQFY